MPTYVYRLGDIMRQVLHAAYRYSPQPFCVTGMHKGTTAAIKLSKRGLLSLDGFDKPKSEGGRCVVMLPAVKQEIDAGRLVVPGIDFSKPCESEVKNPVTAVSEKPA